MKNIYFALLLFFAACSTIPAGQTGYASWYGGKFHGRKTANGEIFDTYKFTAAHRSLPFDTGLKVTNLGNHHCKQSIGCNVEGNPKKNISAALIKLTT